MHGSFVLPWDRAWSPASSRFVVRPLPPHRAKALLSACPDGLGAINREEAGLSRLSPGHDGRRHHGHSLDRGSGRVAARGTAGDRPGLSPPSRQARGLLPPWFVAHAAGPADGDTENRKPSRPHERPQRRADAVRGHRDRQDQSRTRAGHTGHDNHLMSASRSAPRSCRESGQTRDPRLQDRRLPRPAPQPDPPLHPAIPRAWPARDPRNSPQHSTSEDDGRAGTGRKTTHA
jgi:hypothetical protein